MPTCGVGKSPSAFLSDMSHSTYGFASLARFSSTIERTYHVIKQNVGNSLHVVIIFLLVSFFVLGHRLHLISGCIVSDVVGGTPSLRAPPSQLSGINSQFPLVVGLEPSTLLRMLCLMCGWVKEREVFIGWLLPGKWS